MLSRQLTQQCVEEIPLRDFYINSRAEASELSENREEMILILVSGSWTNDDRILLRKSLVSKGLILMCGYITGIFFNAYGTSYDTSIYIHNIRINPLHRCVIQYSVAEYLEISHYNNIISSKFFLKF